MGMLRCYTCAECSKQREGRLLEIKASSTPAVLESLLKAVRTIAVSTGECERAFSTMNDILTAKRNALSVSRDSSMFLFFDMQQTTAGTFQSRYIHEVVAVKEEVQNKGPVKV